MSDNSIAKGSVSDIFIKRPVMTMLLALSALLFGIYSYKAMPVNDLPGVDYPVIQVNVSYPGADPSIMAANCASPLEQQFMQIQGIEMITSTNSFGSTQVVLQFNLQKSIDAAANDVQAAIQRAMGNLPVDLPSPPSFSKDNPNDTPMIIFAILSTAMTEGDLYEYAFAEISQQISMIEGVSKVDIYASPRAVRVEADMDKLFSLGITMTDLRTALSRTSNMYGAGQLDGGSNQFLLLPQTQLSKASDYEKIVVAYKGGVPVYLRDVAKIVDALQADTLNKSLWLGEVEGYDKDTTSSVILAVRKTASGNAITTVANILKKVKEINASLPSSMSIEKVYDRSILIIDNIADVEETILIAFVLVVLVIFFFLGRVRDTLIPAIALPFSLVLTFIFMKLFGFSINNLSLMGLTMAIGFLVDDAIVFLENTVRRMEDFKESPLESAFASAKEISFTILSMTLSLAAVFLPLVFMGGIIGRVFFEFSITIIVATLMSGLVSLTLTPLMCARLLQSRKDKEDRTKIEMMAHHIEASFLKFYNPTLRWMLNRHVLSFLIVVSCLGGSAWYFKNLPATLFPDGDSGFSMGAFVSSTKNSPQELGRIQEDLYQMLKRDPNVKNAFLISGISGIVSSNMGIVGVMFKEDTKSRQPINVASAAIMQKGMLLPDVVFPLTPQPTLKVSTGAVSNTLGKYQYALRGMDQNELYRAANQLFGVMKMKGADVFSSVNSDLYLDNPQVLLNLDREKASMLGVSAEVFSSVFRDTYAKFYFYLIKTTFNQYWSILEAKKSSRSSVSDVEGLYFNPDTAVTGGIPVSPLGGRASTVSTQEPYTLSNLIPFDAIATSTLNLAPVTVNHINNFPSVTISFNLADGVAISEAIEWVNKEAAQILPKSVRGEFVGEAVSFSQMIKSIVTMLFVAVFVMYVILGILYESYIHPITVLIALPMALIGGLACLYYMGMQLSVYSAIGLFMLMGIVKKNGILVVDFAIAREHEGKSPRDAVHEACMERFRPIIMTTFAALMGMLPIALGWGKADAESRIPLGVVVVGGLIFSQVITLYVTPVVYIWMDWIQTNILDKIGFFKRTEI